MQIRTARIVKSLALAIAVVATTSAVLAHSRWEGQLSRHFSRILLAFGSMYGVDEGFVGAASPIRGVVGDELPWTIESGRGFLTNDGVLRVQVRGLVFTDDEIVPPELRGINDETEFRALVSCMSEDSAGVVTTENVTTEGFPATPDGNSDIVAHITLPNPCVAPIVLILAGSEDKWFAANGFEAEEDEDGDDDHHGDNDGDDDDDDEDDD